jgi:hypothetical protein
LIVPSPLLRVSDEQKTPSLGHLSTSSTASQAPLTPLAPFALTGPQPNSQISNQSSGTTDNSSSGSSTPGPVFEFIAASSNSIARQRSDSAIGPTIISLTRQSSTTSSNSNSNNTCSQSACSSTPSTPGKESSGQQQQQQQRRTGPVLPRPAVSAFRTLAIAKDLNPLAPCGSCKEWLKKIAEVNPDFTVVTFSNSALESIYVDPIINWA